MTRLHKRSVFRPRLIQPPSPDDSRGATPERMRHAQGFVERGNLGRGRTGIVTMRDSPVERARARNVINQAQYTAALKYRHHWYRAGLASPLSSVEIEAEIAARAQASAVIIAEQGHWWTSIIRPLAALPVVIYLWKVVVYDKVLGLGTTDPITDDVGAWAGVIITTYFGGRTIEKVARIFRR